MLAIYLNHNRSFFLSPLIFLLLMYYIVLTRDIVVNFSEKWTFGLLGACLVCVYYTLTILS